MLRPSTIIFMIIAAIAFVTALEVPKECTFSTPNYNEIACRETCTKEPHTREPYCANFTASVAVPNPGSLQNQQMTTMEPHIQIQQSQQFPQQPLQQQQSQQQLQQQSQQPPQQQLPQQPSQQQPPQQPSQQQPPQQPSQQQPTQQPPQQQTSQNPQQMVTNAESGPQSDLDPNENTTDVTPVQASSGAIQQAVAFSALGLVLHYVLI